MQDLDATEPEVPVSLDPPNYNSVVDNVEEGEFSPESKAKADLANVIRAGQLANIRFLQFQDKTVRFLEIVKRQEYYGPCSPICRQMFFAIVGNV